MTDRELRPGQAASRPAGRLALGAVLVVVVVGLIAVLAGAGTPTSPGTSPTASSALADLPLVTVAPTSAPVASATFDLSPSVPSPDPTAEAGIRADRIRVATLGIDLAIIEGDGIDAPIGKAAHYPTSAWPGGGSNIYIYGHAREGMFITLWQVRVDDTVELDLIDGTSRTYVVTKVLPEVPWDAVEYLDPTPTEQLTLQTSTSYYPTAPRFVVIAVPAT